MIIFSCLEKDGLIDGSGFFVGRDKIRVLYKKKISFLKVVRLN